MAESVFSRVNRLVSAAVEDTVDRMETSGGDAVMREAIREVDRAIDQIKGEQQIAMARRLQAARQQKLLADRVMQLNEKAKFALGEGRDDLAEAALSRQIDFEAQGKTLDVVQETSKTEEARLEGNLAALKTRKSQMEDALAAFVTAKRDAALGGDGPTHNDIAIERNVDRAEQAFDRAMTGAGGVGFTRAEADTINRVAEIDGMVKTATVSERLAALKAQSRAA